MIVLDIVSTCFNLPEVLGGLWLVVVSGLWCLAVVTIFSIIFLVELCLVAEVFMVVFVSGTGGSCGLVIRLW